MNAYNYQTKETIMNYLNTKAACDKLGIHSNTLRNWANSGKIKTIRTPGNHRLYDLTTFQNDKKKIIYARVSYKNQNDDLDRQIEFLRNRYPNYELISDIGSGLNFKRKGLKTLLDRIIEGDISEVVISHKDRLARFGFEFIEYIASKYACKFVVLNESNLSPQEELVRDLLSIIHVFSCRIYGLRKYSRKIKEDKDLS